MQIVLLSGGSGKRLWPLSNDIRSKQFMKIFKTTDGGYESMVQRMYRSICEVMPGASVTVATGKTQRSGTINQLGDSVNVCIEPSRRDTFPAIALACSYLHDVKKVSLDETIIVCPVDPYVERDYFETIKKIGDEVSASDAANLVLMGIRPTYPSEKYGYILVDKDGKVEGFKEKPDLETAKKLLETGALWNGGVFGFKLSYMLKKAEEFLETSSYEALNSNYANLTKISVDYAVVEKEKNIKSVSFDGDWIDVGTWKTLTDVMPEKSIGNVKFDDTCENTHVINEMDIPILAMGLKDVIVAASADGILVADKTQSGYMKPYVDSIEGPAMFAEKSWGSYKVLDIEEKGMTLKVTLFPGHAMHYHSHENRDEVWTIVEGDGEVLIDGESKKVTSGDTVTIPKGCKHKITAVTTLKLFEVQIGSDIDVKDKTTYD